MYPSRRNRYLTGINSSGVKMNADRHIYLLLMTTIALLSSFPVLPKTTMLLHAIYILLVGREGDTPLPISPLNSITL